MPEAVAHAGPIAANVPGCVHTALLAKGLIADPVAEMTEKDQHWIGRTDWRYELIFTPDASLLEQERVDLVCDGLDTVARIELNGTLVATTENMHVGHRFDVKKLLKPGEENRLTITFASTVHYARQWEQKLGKLPYMNCSEPFNMIRKMACNFGWDWGPMLVTSGIWQPIRLEGWSRARVDHVDVDLLATPSGAHQVTVRLDLEETDRSAPCDVRLFAPDGTELKRDTYFENAPGSFARRFTIENPQLWWPIGYGAQPLYTVRVSAGEHVVEKRIGLRTIELDTSPDTVGSRFVVKVNGKPVFCKGFNWIPDDVYLERACTRERYERRITQAINANANMLRVWGGGIYETDAFYDVCDEKGILVWQDFLFACACYPEEEPFRSLVEQEVRYNVQRLRHHASLALWNGCNENVWGYRDWGWKALGHTRDRTWGAGYYFDLLPKLTKQLDPARPYWAASPWSGDPDFDNGLHPNLASHGNKHVWEAWFGDNYTAYRRFEPRFCSEFGFQAPATHRTLSEVMPADQLKPGTDAWKHRQRSNGGDDRNLRHLAQTFDVPTDNDDLLFLLQLNQARALTLGVEWFRSRAPVCMGALYWQLNDIWPAVSWSAIDWAGRFKPLWYATRKFFAPRLLTIQPGGERYDNGDDLFLHAINDTDEPWTGEVIVKHVSFTDGDIAGTAHRAALRVGPRSTQRIVLYGGPVATLVDPQRQCIVATAGEHRATWFALPDKRLVYPEPKLSSSVMQAGDVLRMKLHAQTLVRDLCIFADRIDPAGVASDQLLTLLPGESATIDLRTRADVKSDELMRRPVLNCANWFGAKA